MKISIYNDIRCFQNTQHLGRVTAHKSLPQAVIIRATDAHYTKRSVIS